MYPGSIITDKDPSHLAINYKVYRTPLRLLLPASLAGLKSCLTPNCNMAFYESQEDA